MAGEGVGVGCHRSSAVPMWRLRVTGYGELPRVGLGLGVVVERLGLGLGTVVERLGLPF